MTQNMTQNMTLHMTLPDRRPGHPTYAVALVCLGNICRSPMAEVILTAKLGAAGLSDRVSVESAGTGDWHVGEPMDRRAAATLSAAGYDPSRHRAATFEAGRLGSFDMVLAMDAGNRRDIAALARLTSDYDRLRMFREFDPDSSGDLDVPDPWYGGEGSFDTVIDIVERTTDELVRLLTLVA